MRAAFRCLVLLGLAFFAAGCQEELLHGLEEAEASRLAVLMMASFGLGTIPAMMAVPSLLHGMTPALRSTAMRTAAVMMIVLGVMTIYRSAMHMHQM